MMDTWPNSYFMAVFTSVWMSSQVLVVRTQLRSIILAIAFAVNAIA
jgi:hypothetical protein